MNGGGGGGGDTSGGGEYGDRDGGGYSTEASSSGADLNGLDAYSDDADGVRSWLNDNKLADISDTLVNAGVDTMAVLLDVTEGDKDDLAEEGLKKMKFKTLMKAIDAVKVVHASNSSDTPSSPPSSQPQNDSVQNPWDQIMKERAGAAGGEEDYTFEFDTVGNSEGNSEATQDSLLDVESFFTALGGDHIPSKQIMAAKEGGAE